MSITAYQYRLLNKRRNQFGAQCVRDDGYTFQSIAERNRYRELKMMQGGKVIFDLKVHPKFPFKIRPELQDEVYEIWSWTADFQYSERLQDGEYRVVVEDVKGTDKKTGKQITNTSHSQRNHILFRILYPEIDLRIVER